MRLHEGSGPLGLNFAGTWLTADSEPWQLVRVVLGYTMAGLIAFRVVWGFVGPRHARFSRLRLSRQPDRAGQRAGNEHEKPALERPPARSGNRASDHAVIACSGLIHINVSCHRGSTVAAIMRLRRRIRQGNGKSMAAAWSRVRCQSKVTDRPVHDGVRSTPVPVPSKRRSRAQRLLWTLAGGLALYLASGASDSRTTPDS